MTPRCRTLRRTSVVLGAALAAAALSPSASSAADLWVDRDAACSDARTRTQASASATPWCTVVRATTQALPGDTVRVRAGVYRGQVRFERSGTTSAPIRLAAAEPGVVIDGGGAAEAILFKLVTDVEVSGVRVTGGATQGVWIEGGARVSLRGVELSGNPGAGVRLRGTTDFTLADSLVAGNGSAGVMEIAGSVRARYTGNTVRDNGKAAAAYNGDGLQLGGTGALVAGNVITGNGSGAYEHGIYTGTQSSGWTIEGNTLAHNAGANVKAAGGPGVVRRNLLTGGQFGLVLSDNPAPVDVDVNVLQGYAQHLVLLTAGSAPSRARMRANTIVQNGRSTASGEASAVFVLAAASLELRDNLVCYQGADSLGVSVMVNDASRLGSLVSEANWFCARDGQSRHLGWDGSRVPLTTWRTRTGEDARSLTSWAPSFDPQQRVTSTNWGRDRGDWLGLPSDFGGAQMPGAGSVDIGAWQN
jgi:hypothetical protein